MPPELSTPPPRLGPRPEPFSVAISVQAVPRGPGPLVLEARGSSLDMTDPSTPNPSTPNPTKSFTTPNPTKSFTEMKRWNTSFKEMSEHGEWKAHLVSLKWGQGVVEEEWKWVPPGAAGQGQGQGQEQQVKQPTKPNTKIKGKDKCKGKGKGTGYTKVKGKDTVKGN